MSEKTAIPAGDPKLLLSNVFAMVKEIHCSPDLTVMETLANRTEPQRCLQIEGLGEASTHVQQLIMDRKTSIANTTRTAWEYSWSEVNTFRTFIAAHSVTAYKARIQRCLVTRSVDRQLRTRTIYLEMVIPLAIILVESVQIQ